VGEKKKKKITKWKGEIAEGIRVRTKSSGELARHLGDERPKTGGNQPSRKCSVESAALSREKNKVGECAARNIQNLPRKLQVKYEARKG